MPSSRDRVFFLDNLRYILVLLVVVLHAAAAYSSYPPWWCVREPGLGRAAMDRMTLVLDTFLMPALFFVAGYFFLPSLIRSGPVTFTVKKLKRLGVPVLVMAPLLNGIFHWVMDIQRFGMDNQPERFVFWQQELARMFTFNFGFFTSIRQFSVYHLWFMTLLLSFYLIFSPVFFQAGRIKSGKIKAGRWMSPPVHGFPPRTGIIFIATVLIAALTSIVGGILFSRPYNPNPWIGLGNIIQFQPIRLGTYIAFFGSGVLAFRRQWFTGRHLPGKPLVWAGCCILLSAGLILLMENRGSMAGRTSVLLAVCLVYALMAAAFLGFLLSAGQRYLDRDDGFNRSMAADSYYTYIIHFPLVILLQFLLTFWHEGTAPVKFVLVSAGAVVLTVALSRYAAGPRPVLTAAAAWIAVFFLLPVLGGGI